MRQLSPWNPLDYARLLWWTLLTPRRLLAHREAFGRRAEYGLARWLCSTFFWLPFIIPAMAMSMGSRPEGINQTTNHWITAIVIALWILYAVIQQEAEVEASIVYGFCTSAAWLIRTYIHLAFPMLENTNPIKIIVSAITNPVAIIILMSTSDNPIEKRIKADIIAGRPSRIAQAAMIVMVLSYAFSLWYNLLGGWRVYR